MVTQTSETSDRELAQEIEAAETSGKPAGKGLLHKVRDRLQERAERRGVELPDGSYVSAATARLIRANEGAEFLGTELHIMVRVTGGHGLERTEVWNPNRQNANEIVPGSKRQEILEYTRVLGTTVMVAPTGEVKDKTPVGQKTPDRIFMAKNGREPIYIGQHFSLACLQRLEQRGTLSTAGERLLHELTEEHNGGDAEQS